MDEVFPHVADEELQENTGVQNQHGSLTMEIFSHVMREYLQDNGL